MKTDTRENIFWYIDKYSPVTVKNIVEEFWISKQIIHKHLTKLFSEDRIYKVWTPPKVYYFPVNFAAIPILGYVGDWDDIQRNREILQKHFVDFWANGEVKYWMEWFIKWCQKRGFSAEKEIEIYKKTLDKYSKYKDEDWLIDGINKMKQSFDEVFLDKVFYLDFYAIEKYWKTLLGNLMLYAKQTSNKELAWKVLEIISDKVYKLIEKYDIDSFAFIPPSIDRKIQLMDELKNGLNLDLKELKLLKIFKDKPVPQKSLNKKSDRIINASQTIFIGDNKFRWGNILLIDDAVGSWATLNETAKKIKEKGLAKNVYGLAIVWSYKWFEVINEV